MTAAAPDEAMVGWPRLEKWLGRRRRVVFMLLLGAALLFRLVYFLQINPSPVLDAHRVSGLDQQLFHNWACQLAAGDWLQRKPRRPRTRWMEKLADLCLEQRPSLPLELGLATRADYDRKEMRERLWTHWLQGACYYQEPLYPYLVALTYRLLGTEVRWVFAWQLLLGVVNIALIHGIARRCFGETVAVLAGMMAVFYGPLMFHEIVLLRTTLITFTGLLLVYLSLRLSGRATPLWWFGLGLLLGVALLVKMIFAVWIVFLAAWIIRAHRENRARAVKLLLGLAAGVALSLAPVVIRNSRVNAPLFNWSGSALTSVSLLNTADAPPCGFYVSAKHMPGVLIRSQGKVFPAFIEAVSTHESAFSFIKLWARKFAHIWHKYEVPNNASFYYYRSQASLLRWLGFPYAAIAVLGLAGVAMSLPRRRKCWPLYLLIATGILSMLLVSVMSRFRVPMVAGLFPFAGFSLLQMGSWAVTGQRLRLLATILLMSLLWLWCAGPLPEGFVLWRPSDF